MKEFRNTIQLVFSAAGGRLGLFLGGCDGLLYALVAFVVIDYITGVFCAGVDHKISGEIGFKGICKKVLIFIPVGVGNIMQELARRRMNDEIYKQSVLSAAKDEGRAEERAKIATAMRTSGMTDEQINSILNGQAPT